MSFFQKRKEVRGAIAILLVVIMLPMMTLSAFMVDTARYTLAKSMVSSAGDLAMNGALADYDTILKDVYGLFAVSQTDDIEKNVKNYFKDTLVGYGVVEEDDAEDYVSSLLGSVYEYLVVEDKETVNFLNMTIDDTELTVNKVGGTGTAGSGLDNPDILEKQIVEYMKYRGPVDFGLSFVDSLSAFTRINDQTTVLEAQVKAQEEMQEVTDANSALYEAVKKYDEKYSELEPEGALPVEFHLTAYGTRLNSYKDRYQRVNRLTDIFCVGAKYGNWNLSDSDLLVLNGSGDFISSGSSYSITNHLPGTEVTEYLSADADEVMNNMYNALKAPAVSELLKGYGGTKFNNSWTPEYGIEGMTEQVIADFRSVDGFLKDSYEEYIGAAKQVDHFYRAVEVYGAKAEEVIEDLDSDISELEEDISDMEERKMAASTPAAEKVALAADISEAEEAIEALETEKTEYENAKSDMEGKLQEILGEYAVYLNSFNSDAKAYRQCVSDVADCVTIEAAYIAGEFSTIYNNLISLRDLLAEVQMKLGDSKTLISAYMTQVGKWKSSNSSYVSSAGEDSFSEVNSAGIAEAENTFNEADIQELLDKVTDEKNKVNNCITQIDAGSNFTFQGVRINFLYTAEDVERAIETGTYGGTIAGYRTTGTISDEKCNDYFVYTGSVDEHFLDNLKQLAKPYPCCRFMHYLYQTYGRDMESLTAEGSEAKKKADDDKENYKKIKDNSAGVSGDLEKESATGYGYTYDGKTVSTDGYPSKGEEGAKTVNSSKSNGVAGLTENKAVANDILNGLANAMETGRDKLLVTSYLFENFSYNTMVQDMAREGLEDAGKKAPAWPTNCSTAIYEDYLDTAVTSSGVSISARNNQLYGAEIEYILYGNTNVSQNVFNAKASIYAIRFLFNAVYAFTDSTVRNETRAVAVAVQAASAGMIPYQLVQVVLQIALAMGESAIDLQNMNVGAKVPIVKSKDTWTLSLQGMGNLALDALEGAAETVLEAAAETLNDRMSAIVDAGASELSDAVDGIEGDLEQCVDKAVEEVLNSITMQIDAAIDSAMSEAAYIADTDIASIDGNIEAVKNYAKAQVDNAFKDAKDQIDILLSTEASDDSVKAVVTGQLKLYIGEILATAQSEINAKITSVSDVTEVREMVYEQVYEVKNRVAELIKNQTDGIRSSVVNAFKGKISEVQDYVKEKASAATAEAKDAILEEINGFIDDISGSSTKFVSGSADGLANVNANVVDSSAKAAMIRFGYSDYLKLFVFIGLCASDKSGAMMKRTADVIQLNISSAGEGSDLQHGAGSAFAMSKAKTYVSLEAKVDLDLMFLNLGVFQRQVESYNEELDEEDKMDLSSTLTIDYIGIAGY